MAATRRPPFHILYLPKWYPNPNDPQLGVFVRKQALAAAEHVPVSVLFPVAVAGLKGKFEIHAGATENLSECLVCFRKSELPWLGRAVNACRYLSSLRRGWKMMVRKQGRPGLVHAHVLLRTAVIALIYRCLREVPYVISEHWSGYLSGEYKSRPLCYRILSRMVVRRASALLCVSDLLAEAMRRQGLAHANTRVVPNVIDFPETLALAGTDEPGKIIMLTVADLVDRVKNISGVLRAVAAVRTRIPGLEYHVIGDGEDRDNLEKLAESLGISDIVTFHGRFRNEEVLDYYGRAGFVVVNSYRETFSAVAAEALAYGKPVLATRCGGPEAFVNKENGLLIHPGVQTELEEALTWMAGHYRDYNPEKLQDSVRQYGSQHIGKQLFEIYSEVLNKKK